MKKVKNNMKNGYISVNKIYIYGMKTSRIFNNFYMTVVTTLTSKQIIELEN